MSRTTISHLELFRVVNEEFSRLRPVECFSCITPIPIRKYPPIEGNWQLSAARSCNRGCREVLREIESRLGPQFWLDDRWVSGSADAERMSSHG